MKEMFGQSINAWNGRYAASIAMSRWWCGNQYKVPNLQIWLMRDRKEKKKFYSLPMESEIHKKFETKLEPSQSQQ